MVAIAVILAAVIAAFVFGITHVVMFTAQKTGTTTITVMDQGGQDQSSLTSVNVSTTTLATGVTDFKGASIAPTGTGPYSYASIDAPTIGESMKLINSAGWPAGTQITIVGNFNDGSQQILASATF